MRFQSTPAQRHAIYELMRKAELDPQTITLMHKPAIEKAGMSITGWIGEPVTTFVSGLSGGQSSAYIAALEAQVGDA